MSYLLALTDLAHGVALLFLAIAAIVALIRLTRGPSSLDRSIATDVLVAVITAGVGLYCAVTHSAYALPILVVLSLLGFTAPVAIARLIASRSALVRDLGKVPLDQGSHGERRGL